MFPGNPHLNTPFMNSTKLVKDEISQISMPRQEGHCKNGVMLLQSIKGPMLHESKVSGKMRKKGKIVRNFDRKRKFY